MARIYISSTREDLQNEREAAAKAVRRLGHQAIYMEDYVATNQRPVDKCVKDVVHCDVYVGIFAFRYGDIPAGQNKSFTHLEYEAAVHAGIPCLIFLMDPDAPHKVKFVDTGDERQKIDHLRQELKEKYMVSFFKSAEELGGLVSSAVSNPKLYQPKKVMTPSNPPKKNNDMDPFSPLPIKPMLEKERKLKSIIPWLAGAMAIVVVVFIWGMIKQKPTPTNPTPMEKNHPVTQSEQKPEPKPPLNNKVTTLPKKEIKKDEEKQENTNTEKPATNPVTQSKQYPKPEQPTETKSIELPAEEIKKEVEKPTPTEISILEAYGVPYDMVEIPGGEFQMGATNGRDNECPVHHVRVSGFRMGKTEVTQGLWKAVMENNPSNFKKGDNYPVEQVSWNDCQDFLKKLNDKTGGNYRLPYEAEWEYACRAGTTGDYYGNLDDIAWYEENSNKAAHPVGQKKENAFGLYDMSGNVYEWCQNWYGPYDSSNQINPTGPASGVSRVCRGGGWIYFGWYARSAIRSGPSPDYRYNDLGFRFSQVISSPASKQQ